MRLHPHLLDKPSKDRREAGGKWGEKRKKINIEGKAREPRLAAVCGGAGGTPRCPPGCWGSPRGDTEGVQDMR